jgi:cell division septation protein DedD
MLRTSESDTEILLGNKQLLGIFLVVAILLGAAFTGGYMVGKGPAPKPAAGPNPPGNTAAQTASNPALGETHVAAPDSASSPTEGPILGARRSPAATSTEAFVPLGGQTFLQVAAVGRDEAEAIADVLRKKHFRAHAVPKPGSPRLFRVLIGPVRDAADLSSTRDALRKTGFGEVIVQKY